VVVRRANDCLLCHAKDQKESIILVFFYLGGRQKGRIPGGAIIRRGSPQSLGVSCKLPSLTPNWLRRSKPKRMKTFATRKRKNRERWVFLFVCAPPPSRRQSNSQRREPERLPNGFPQSRAKRSLSLTFLLVSTRKPGPPRRMFR